MNLIIILCPSERRQEKPETIKSGRTGRNERKPKLFKVNKSQSNKNKAETRSIRRVKLNKIKWKKSACSCIKHVTFSHK